MLKKVRELIARYSRYSFDDVIMTSDKTGNIPLEIFVGCIVLMIFNSHITMHITNVIKEMMRRYPKAVDLTVLKVPNETNVMYNTLVAKELLDKVRAIVDSKMTSPSGLKKIVDEVMSAYFVSQSPQ